MRVGELARRTGVTVRALRYYEAAGLVVPVRLGNGYREYDPIAGLQHRIGELARQRDALHAHFTDGAGRPSWTAGAGSGFRVDRRQPNRVERARARPEHRLRVPADRPARRRPAHRLALPYPLLADPRLTLAENLGLATFEAGGMTLCRRLTLVITDGLVEHVFHPISRPTSHAVEILSWLTNGSTTTKHPGEEDN